MTTFDIIEKARLLCDEKNSHFLSDDELLFYAQEGFNKAYFLALDDNSNNFVKEIQTTVSPITEIIPFPDDFLQKQNLYIKMGDQFTLLTRNDYLWKADGIAVKQDLKENTFVLSYFPLPQILTNNTIFNGSLFLLSGYVLYYICLLISIKGHQDPSFFSSRLLEIEKTLTIFKNKDNMMKHIKNVL